MVHTRLAAAGSKRGKITGIQRSRQHLLDDGLSVPLWQSGKKDLGDKYPIPIPGKENSKSDKVIEIFTKLAMPSI
jgi:hypothetical protein